jgi:hypothetical protein
MIVQGIAEAIFKMRITSIKDQKLLKNKNKNFIIQKMQKTTFRDDPFESDH